MERHLRRCPRRHLGALKLLNSVTQSAKPALDTSSRGAAKARRAAGPSTAGWKEARLTLQQWLATGRNGLEFKRAYRRIERIVKEAETAVTLFEKVWLEAEIPGDPLLALQNALEGVCTAAMDAMSVAEDLDREGRRPVREDERPYVDHMSRQPSVKKGAGKRSRPKAKRKINVTRR